MYVEPILSNVPSPILFPSSPKFLMKNKTIWWVIKCRYFACERIKINYLLKWRTNPITSLLWSASKFAFLVLCSNQEKGKSFYKISVCVRKQLRKRKFGEIIRFNLGRLWVPRRGTCKFCVKVHIYMDDDEKSDLGQMDRRITIEKVNYIILEIYWSYIPLYSFQKSKTIEEISTRYHGFYQST